MLIFDSERDIYPHHSFVDINDPDGTYANYGLPKKDFNLLFQKEILETTGFSSTYYKLEESNKNIVVIFLSSAYYHFIVDVLGSVFYEYEKDKNVKFVFVSNELSKTKEYAYIKFLFKWCNDKGVDYEIIDLQEYYNLKITKARLYNPTVSNTYEDLHKYILKNIKPYIDNNVNKNKKIYVSRSKVMERTVFDSIGYRDPKILKYTDDIRIKNEEIVENYMLENGFKIVNNEKIEDFIEQINIFANASVIISATGASLGNMFFMQPEQTVVELITPLVIRGSISIHQLYHEAAIICENNYIGLYHDREAENAIKELEKFKSVWDKV